MRRLSSPFPRSASLASSYEPSAAAPVVTVASRLSADMREAKEGERFRLPFSALFPVSGREPSELQKPRFVGMQFQAELPKPLGEFGKNLFGIRFALESNHDVVRVPHDDHIAVRLLSTPCLSPQIERVMEIDIRQQRRCTAALRRSFLHAYSFPILQHACVQPFLDEPQDTPVRDATLDELYKPFVRNRIEEPRVYPDRAPSSPSSSTVRCKAHPAHCAGFASDGTRTKIQESRFVDSIHHLDRRTLNDLVLQRSDSERSQPPSALGMYTLRTGMAR